MRITETVGGTKVWRKAVRWSCAALLPGELAFVLCLAGGVAVPPLLRSALELSVLAVMTGAGALFALDHRRHRRGGLGRRAALGAALADTVPAPVRRLTAHEVFLSTSFLRWVTRRGPHGVRDGDLAVPYAPGQTAVMLGFFFVCVVETVALAFLIPWPMVHAVTLVLDIWGCYFVIALHASCAVRPHVIGADGSLRLRYGALLDIRVPAGRIASVRQDRRFPESRPGAVDGNGVAELAVGGQTTVTVELTEPVRYTRVLGSPAEARTLRFYAEDAGAAVAALRRGPRPASTPISAD
ncbi:hypothetical protein [Streptomyces sp. YS415]|uniref:hypothetical protein n=1 Tax=Streptomyces sp. YS415 TaxID=2944806 RepID=UPI002020AC98|nr:hypothetical protein [Streptomyces sp. YS415]MCL7428051.1 hypothetical protein [Streptomyces sp. YS415]